MRIKRTACERCDDGTHEIEDVLLSHHNCVVGSAEGIPEDVVTRLALRRGTLERCPGECGDPFGARSMEWIHAA